MAGDDLPGGHGLDDLVVVGVRGTSRGELWWDRQRYLEGLRQRQVAGDGPDSAVQFPGRALTAAWDSG
ncbi:hypothetical protein [Catenulispora pinisilvae]|uniref:hypothetical protein n=1 Tax=Catenulispora pinisilvae TaxID=2705253 RepID=UPI001E656691|nr:hypothetical protein [Catenulispora pinisilvae]